MRRRKGGHLKLEAISDWNSVVTFNLRAAFREHQMVACNSLQRDIPKRKFETCEHRCYRRRDTWASVRGDGKVDNDHNYDHNYDSQSWLIDTRFITIYGPQKQWLMIVHHDENGSQAVIRTESFERLQSLQTLKSKSFQIGEL